MASWRAAAQLLVLLGASSCNIVSGVGDYRFDREPAASTGSVGSTGNGGTGGGGTGGDGGQGGTGAAPPATCNELPACEGESSRDACIPCAVAGPCAVPFARCLANPGCVQFSLCMEGCTEALATCLTNCGALFPDGRLDYLDHARCLHCVGCPDRCDNPGYACFDP